MVILPNTLFKSKFKPLRSASIIYLELPFSAFIPYYPLAKGTTLSQPYSSALMFTGCRRTSSYLDMTQLVANIQKKSTSFTKPPSVLMPLPPWLPQSLSCLGSTPNFGSFMSDNTELALLHLITTKVSLFREREK